MTWGPEGRKAAIGISFDNFGEAFDVEQGTWPNDVPVGDHYTAKTVLPRMLRDMERHSISGTFFVEGWNATVYPDDLISMSSAGHEVGLHGWRHELWFAQSAQERVSVIDRSLGAMKAIGLSPVGFRPPGGLPTDDTDEILKKAGFRYSSAAGDGVTGSGDIAEVPFRWGDVDALYLEPQLGVVRKAMYGSEDLLTLAHWVDALKQLETEVVERGSCYTLIFHPYLLGEDEKRYAVFAEFLEHIKGNDDIWLATCAEIADWARSHSL